jgi:hypothetical protein
VLSRLISFADPAGGAYGSVAIDGDGRAAGVVHTGGDGEGAAVAVDDAIATRGEGSLRIEGEGGTLVLGLVARTTPLAFETGPERSVEIQSVGVSASLTPAGGDETGFEAEGIAWAVSGEDDQGSIRTLWALGGNGLFAMFALRAADATDHAAETVGAVRIAADGSVLAYEEPLLSTEYDASGRHTRATLELWGGDESGMADRGGGKRLGGGCGRIGNADLEAAAFAWTLGGRPGAGGYEIFKAT